VAGLRFLRRKLAAGSFFLRKRKQGGFMARSFRREIAAKGADATLSDGTWEFVQAILGKPVLGATQAESEARAERELSEWVAAVAPKHERQWRPPQRDKVDTPVPRELPAWVDAFAERVQSQLRSLAEVEAELSALEERCQQQSAGLREGDAKFSSALHPRDGVPPNPGWFANTGGGAGGGGGSSAGARKPTSFLDAVIKRNQQVAELTGFASPGLIASNRLAVDLQAAGRLPAEMARGAAAGLGTGAKALVNGSATAIKTIATLGFSNSQLELIGVTKEDRERGYDQAVAIATASGEVLIAVGTGGLTAALSKGGTIARTTSGALVAYDAAGNAVGVVRGTYDAAKNGINLSNGAQIAAGVLGLGANVKAARGLKPPDLVPKGFDPVKGFATFDDFKDAFGAAGPGLAWHHVVEQTINSGKFAAELLHNPANLLKLPHGKGTIHAKISGYYNSRPDFAKGLKLREWLSKKSFKEQFDFGIKTINRFGGTQYLPPDLR